MFFFQNKIGSCGHEVDSKSLHKTEKKIRAVVEATVITNVRELRSGLGLAQYYSKFMPNLSSVVYPLHQLLHEGTEWR